MVLSSSFINFKLFVFMKTKNISFEMVTGIVYIPIYHINPLITVLYRYLYHIISRPLFQSL